MNKLKGKLVEKQKTYKDCADVLGISIHAFTNKINGRSKFTVPEAKALADYLQLTASEIIEIFYS